jgi:hypothetical protein
MLIIKGPGKGRTVRAHQWSNDWISADDENGKPLILSPRSVRLDDEEIARFRATLDATRIGYFWKWWELLDDGTFLGIRPHPSGGGLGLNSTRTIRKSSEEAGPCTCQPVGRICRRCKALGREFNVPVTQGKVSTDG